MVHSLHIIKLIIPEFAFILFYVYFPYRVFSYLPTKLKLVVIPILLGKSKAF